MSPILVAAARRGNSSSEAGADAHPTIAVAGISTNTGHDGDTDDGEWAGPHNDVSTREKCEFSSAHAYLARTVPAVERNRGLGLARAAPERARGQAYRAGILRQRRQHVVLSGVLDGYVSSCSSADRTLLTRRGTGGRQGYVVL